MATATIHPNAKKLIQAIARRHGVSTQTMLHALINYATSIEIRPGSWEAAKPFEFANYDERSNRSCADRWFSDDYVATNRLRRRP